MPFPDQPPPLPHGAAKEKRAKPGRGQPYKYLPVKTILRRLEALQKQIVERGEECFDPGFEAKRGALMGMLTFEYAMQADDEELPLSRRLDAVARIVPFLNYLKDLTPREQAKYPKTEGQVDHEIQARLGKLNKLIAKDVPVEKVLDTLAPAAAAPPEEA